jgi:hypothetical protein
MSTTAYVMPPALTIHGLPEAPLPTNELADLLRQLLAVQQEQVALVKAQQAKDDNSARWRTFLARWDAEFPGLGSACKQVLPIIERAYLSVIRDMTDRLLADPDALGDEFLLSEFLDRYGIRLGQLGNLLGQLAPLADASSTEKG